MNEYHLAAVIAICITVAVIFEPHDCLTGHDIDAKIQQNFNPNPKGEN